MSKATVDDAVVELDQFCQLGLDVKELSGGRAALQELIMRIRGTKAIRKWDHFPAFREVAARLWLQRIPQMGGRFDCNHWLGSLPWPSPNLIARCQTEQNTKAADLILIDPAVSAQALCCLQSIRYEPGILQMPSSSRPSSPYWLAVGSPCLRQGDGLRWNALTVQEMLFLHAQVDIFKDGHTNFCIEGFEAVGRHVYLRAYDGAKCLCSRLPADESVRGSTLKGYREVV